jgi:hypothetical protein
MAKEKEPKQPREYVPVSFKVYEDEDPDLVELLKEYPKTWLIKKALRHWRDTQGEQQPKQPQTTDAENMLSDL